MLKNNIRICDVCSTEIPKGEIYRVVIVELEIIEIFMKRDLELVPTWTQNPDGTVRLEICLDCHLSMGKIEFEEKIN